MGFKSFPDVADFAEFAESLHQHGAEREQAVMLMLQRVRPNTLDGFGTDDLATASRVLEGAFHDIDRAVEDLRVQNEALVAARFDVEESSAICRDLFERAPFAHLVTTTEAQTTFANEAACRLLRRSKNALVRKPLACFVPLDERDAFREALARSCTSPAVATLACLPDTHESRHLDSVSGARRRYQGSESRCTDSALLEHHGGDR